MQLVLDIGNTAIKAAWFRGKELLEVRVIPEAIKLPEDYFHHPGKPDQVLVASVRDEDPGFLNAFYVPVHHLSGKTKLPFDNQYATPLTLGADRLANVAGALGRFPGKNVLVVDCGTCIKYDLLLAEGAYAGGSISPGLGMRYKALHTYTGKLPLLEPVEEIHLTGKTTAESIHSGVINGMLAEIDGIIARYTKIYPGLECVLTGGDHALFSGKLKSRIFAAPALTLEGLNTILLQL